MALADVTPDDEEYLLVARAAIALLVAVGAAIFLWRLAS
jgi:preprotein translocase subunit Sss1